VVPGDARCIVLAFLWIAAVMILIVAWTAGRTR
jgi:hypothetical protein